MPRPLGYLGRRPLYRGQASGCARKTVPVVRRQPVHVGTLRDYPGRVDPVLRLVVVRLNLHEIGRVAEPATLVQVPGVPPQMRIVYEPVQVALEVGVVNGVEPDQGREEA